MEYLIHFSDGSDAYLAHHGVLGQKWGRRRYQNPDGSYKPGAKGRYNPDGSKSSFRTRHLEKKMSKLSEKKKFDVDSFDAITSDLKYKNGKTFYSVADAKRDQKAVGAAYDKKISKVNEKLEKSRARDAYKDSDEYKAKMAKRVAVGTAVVAGTALAAYGGYKLNKYVKTAAYEKSHERGVQATERIFKKVDTNTKYDTADNIMTNYGGRDALLRDADSAARYNSRNFVESVKTLRGGPRTMSRAEQTIAGIKTAGVTKNGRDSDGLVNRYHEIREKELADRRVHIDNRNERVVKQLDAAKKAGKEPSATGAYGRKVSNADKLSESIERARKAGVPEKDIIKNLDDLDKFFGFINK